MMQRAITIEELARKLKPLFGKKVDELYFRYSIADTPTEKNEIFQVMSRLYQKHLSKLLDKGILLEPPIEENVKGEYPLAKVSYAEKELYDFSLQEKDWPRHMCVTGMSGSGKTTFGFQILKNFIEKDKPFLVFDWKKSFRPLMGIDKELMVFTVGNDDVSNLFRVNVNRPPKGVNPKEWINTLCDLLTESFSASFGVHKVLLETLDEAFENWGVYNGGNNYPNWQHIKKLMEQKSREAKGRETGWYESALRIASILTFGAFGKVVNYDGKRSLSVEDLFDKRVVLELNPLASIEKKFFSEYLLTYIFKLKKAEQNKVDEKFNYAIMVDEAHNIFLKKPTSFMAESVTDMIYREMREYGSSLICLDQHISKLSDTVTGNSACHIAFQQQLPQDIESMSGLMQLRDNREMFSQVPVGQAIAKMSSRHTSPFLINVPFMDLRKVSSTDEDVKTRMQFMIDGAVVAKNDREFLEEIQKPEVVKIKQKRVSVDTSLTEAQKILFEFVAKQRGVGQSLFQIEKMLEAGLHEKMYSVNDIIKTINYAMKLEMEDGFNSKDEDTTFQKLKSLSEEDSESVEIYTPQEALIVEAPKEVTKESVPAESMIPLRSDNGYSRVAKPTESGEVIVKGISQMEEANIEVLVEKEAPKITKIEEPKVEEEAPVVEKIEESKEEIVVEEKEDVKELSSTTEEKEEELKEKSEDSIPAKLPEITPENPKSETVEIAEKESVSTNEEANVLQISSVEEQSDLENNSLSESKSVQSSTPEVQLIEDEDEDIVDAYFPPKTDQELTKEEIEFLKFLHYNKEHEKSTVELYKEVGLSARKGNVVKNKLMDKNLIMIEKEVTDKGWKKYIRLKQ
jgi:hypothetical protein